MVQPLEGKISELEIQLKKVKSHANENEQYSRRCNVRIYGIPEVEVEGENCNKVVSDFCKDDLKYISEYEIDRTHRVSYQGKGRLTTSDNCKVFIVPV